MAQITLKRGLNVPIKGEFSSDQETLMNPKSIALDCSTFSQKARIKPLKKEGESIALGEPLAIDAHQQEKVLLSPAGGKVIEIKRAEKRRLISIVIERAEKEEENSFSPLEEDLKPEDLLKELAKRGALWHITERPLSRTASSERAPQAIFISAVESAPLTPPAYHEVEEEKELFQYGISLLSKLAPVHLVNDHPCFDNCSNAQIHTAKGPHPVGDFSLHIAALHPIQKPTDTIWTLKPLDVLCLASICRDGKFFKKQIVAITGEKAPKEQRKLYWVRRGTNLHELLGKAGEQENVRIISGNPLTGSISHGHLGFFDRSLTLLSNNPKRSILRFLYLWTSRYTASKAYLNLRKNYDFSTGLLGEERAIVDKNIYEKVMPFKIPLEPLIKAILAKDFDQAIQYGFLELAPEDFALAEFICPSKIPFMKIIYEAQQEFVSMYL